MFKLKNLWVALALTTWACSRETSFEPTIDSSKASYQLIQETIFTPSCATSGCHASANDAAFKQHGLVLEASVALQNMVNVLAKNPNARAEGKLLINLKNIDDSFLLHKLHENSDGHHSSSNYGSRMPLGRDPLTDGQIEFIRQWLKAGAPKEGRVADVSLLDANAVAVDDWVNPPTMPVNMGFQMRIPKFEVAPNTNREFYIRQDVGNKEMMYVKSFETLMRAGSHHLLVYNFDDKTNLPPLNQLRDIRYYDNNGNRHFNLYSNMTLTQYVMLSPGGKQFRYDFPDGYALEVEANATYDLNAHYFNTSNKVRYGEVVFNMFTMPKAQVKNVCKPLELYNYEISIPAKTRKIESKDFIFDEDTEVLMLTTHAHKTMERFEVQIIGGKRNGEVLIAETDYSHPQVLNFAKPLQLKKGEGLRSVVTFNNTTNKTLTFGLTTEDEMNIIFGYYVKK